MMLAGVTLNPLQEQIIAAMMAGQSYIGIRAGWGSGKTSGLVLAILYRAVICPGEAMLLITDTSSRFERVLIGDHSGGMKGCTKGSHSGIHSFAAAITSSVCRAANRSSVITPKPFFTSRSK